MARQRARNYDDSSVRFGRGGSFPSEVSVEHVGSKDPRQKSERQLNIRISAIEQEALKSAYESAGGKESGAPFGSFVAGLIADGMNARRDDILMIGDGSVTQLAAIEELGERVAELTRLIEGIGRLGVANSRHIQGLAEAMAAQASAVEGMSQSIAIALDRMAHEQEPNQGGSITDGRRPQ